jgi:hypothetical protein
MTTAEAVLDYKSKKERTGGDEKKEVFSDRFKVLKAR